MSRRAFIILFAGCLALAKNLRIKLGNGKPYNFTEVGGGADQLYAFHREVEGVGKKNR